MNYRHAYHAGNFADVVKHAVLARIVEYLKRKEKPFRVIDTHASVCTIWLPMRRARPGSGWAVSAVSCRRR
jgi:23S rRNA (adenine2030-N6)-methyltransferase